MRLALAAVLAACSPAPEERVVPLAPGGRAVPPAPASPRARPTAPGAPTLTPRQQALLAGARECLGDAYDDSYHSGGPPPKGRGACTDVVWSAALRAGVDLQEEVDRDFAAHPDLYGGTRDRSIDYRRVPNLRVWLSRHARKVESWEPGDLVLWSLTGDGVADHCGVVSDRRAPGGRPLVIHNFPPRCTEDDVLDSWPRVGHFRLR